MLRYFAYGSNMDEQQMYKRCPDARLIGLAILPDYRLDFRIYSEVRKSGCADIVQDTTQNVYGLLFDVTDKDKQALDRFEGHPVHYRRINVDVLHGQNRVPAFAYEVAEKRPYIEPSKGYLDILKTAAEKFSFPEAYRKRLEQIETR